MAINLEGASHVEFNIVDKDKKPTTLLPVNTAEDVIIDENYNFLSDVLPLIMSGSDVAGSVEGSQIKEMTIDDNLYKLLTQDTVI